MHQELIARIVDETQKVIKGKERQVKLALSAFLAGGHVLIEDLPGVGKTTLAKTLAQVLGLEYSRIQFTSDLLPSDIIGVNYFDTRSSAFTFKPGPLFTQFLLADEINRATPKTQSALLEAMEESQVSVEGKALMLPQPFFVIATKNPFEEVGTFELPGSQLDRFALTFSLGYPDAQSERDILRAPRSAALSELRRCTAEEGASLREAARQVRMGDVALDLVQDIVAFTRESGLYRNGLSTRGALALAGLARAWALIEGREYVVPDDVLAVLEPTIAHRLVASEGRKTPQEMVDDILASVHPDA